MFNPFNGSAGYPSASSPGLGDVDGPASSTDNAVVRFDGTGGKTVQNSGVTIDDSGNITAGVWNGTIITSGYGGTGNGFFKVSGPASTEKTMTFPNASSTVKFAGKETAWVGAGQMTPSTTNGAAAATIETATNKVVFDVLDFDATTQEHACFSVALPKSWNNGTVTFQPYWTSTAADTDGVCWSLQAGSFADGDALDTAYGTAVDVTDDAQGTSTDLYIGAESAAITIAGSPASGEYQNFRIFRDVADANDDMVEDARLIGIKLFFTSNAGDDT